MKQSVYRIIDGVPQMEESFLIFIDILGYQAMARSAESQADHTRLLRRLHTALSRHVPDLTGQDEEQAQPWYASRVFTDNIVLARPLLRHTFGEGETELGFMMLDAARYQFNLAREGFFVRGGIAVGMAYVDEHVVFGPALIEAHDLEQVRAVFPRIVLSEGAREYVKKHVSYYAGGAAGAPHNGELLVDSDGEWFINYIDAARGDTDPALIPVYKPLVEQHRDQLVQQLKESRANRRVLEKYIWAGRYHNYVAQYLYPYTDDLLVPAALLPDGFQRLEEVLPADIFSLGAVSKRVHKTKAPPQRVGASKPRRKRK